MQDYSAPIDTPPRRKRSRGVTIFVVLLALFMGAAAIGWGYSHGWFKGLLTGPQTIESEPAASEMAVEPVAIEPVTLTSGESAEPAETREEQLRKIGTVEGRLALLEDRLSRIDFKTDAASGNAARAEGLLIAFAARRMVDRGEPLSYVADQLRLRFTNAQPRAVQTVISFSQNPVTIDELSARLEALSGDLTVTTSDASLWERARKEMSELFVVRRDSAALVSPTARIERARIMLTARRIGHAIAEVERLPGAEAAENWINDARRYQDVQHALDLLETTAMLEPNRLSDAEGHNVSQPSPLATPAPTLPTAAAGNGDTAPVAED